MRERKQNIPKEKASPENGILHFRLARPMETYTPNKNKAKIRETARSTPEIRVTAI
jgi:hypothetical protein